MKEYLAFDVGGTSVKYALCNEEGEVSSASKFKTPDTLDQMYLEMEKVVHNYPNVEGIALSMPGAVDSDGALFMVQVQLIISMDQISKKTYKIVFINL